MRIGLWASLAVVGSCTAFGGGSDLPTGDTATGTTSTGGVRYGTILALTGISQDGAFEYTQQCLVCHPTPGAPDDFPYPNLAEVVPVRSDVQLVAVVVEGVIEASGTVRMPQYDEYFTNQDIADLLAYMRATFGTQAVP